MVLSKTHLRGQLQRLLLPSCCLHCCPGVHGAAVYGCREHQTGRFQCLAKFFQMLFYAFCTPYRFPARPSFCVRTKEEMVYILCGVGKSMGVIFLSRMTYHAKMCSVRYAEGLNCTGIFFFFLLLQKTLNCFFFFFCCKKPSTDERVKDD